MDQNINTGKKHRKVSLEEIKEGCIKLNGHDGTETEVCMVQEELRQGISTIQSYKTAVTFYGSARLPETHPDYQKARTLAHKIVKELGYAVLSGGGPGIMEAANRGASEAGGKSVGLTIRLHHEQITNKYVNDEIPFYFFFTRKVSMSYSTDACLFFPGGFGTLDELFEMITLKQTGKIDPIPLILVGTEYWSKFQSVIEENLLKKYETITADDLKLYTITDDEEEIINIIKNSPIRKS